MQKSVKMGGVVVVEVRGQGRGIVNTKAMAWGQFGDKL